MAELLDDVIEPSELDVVESQIEETHNSAPEEVAQKSAEDELPDFYRGKTTSEIAKMHREATQALSRQGNELGEVRKLADELLKSQLMKKAEQEKPAEVDFFENPQEAIRQAVENNPKVLAAEQYSLQAQRESAKRDLNAKHPDIGQIVGDSEFIDWVKASKVRSQLFQQADQSYDLDAADELLSTFKQLRGVKQQRETAQTQQVVSNDTKVRDQALRAASVETSGTGESTKKVYRSADLIRLKIRDPQRYEAMSDEIYQAYQDGRVR
jgi:hypothetical protein